MILKNVHIVGSNNNPQNILIVGENISLAGVSHSDKEYTLDLRDCIAFPGLINSHEHLEFNLYPRLGHKVYNDYVEWGNDIHLKDKELIDTVESVPVELRMKYGIIKNLICGVTSVAQHGEYRNLPEDSPVNVIESGTCIHSVRLGGKWKYKINLPGNSDPFVIHIGEGINTESSEEIDELIRWNLFGRTMIGIHGIALTEKQSRNFAALIWCPDSNLFLFGKTADIRTLKKSTKILFGTDSTLTADRNIFENLRTARNLNQLTDEELFHSVTKTAAEVWKLKDRGSIANGCKADIVIAHKKSEDLFESFYCTDPEDILLIIKDGKITLFDNTLNKEIPNTLKHKDGFEEISVKGKVKYADFGITEILRKIRKSGLDNLSL